MRYNKHLINRAKLVSMEESVECTDLTAFGLYL